MSIQQRKIANQQLLHESRRALIYRGDRMDDGRSVILKTLKTDYANTEGLAWFRREYEIIRNLEIAGAIAAYEFWDDRYSPTIVLEDFGGKSLTELEIAGKLSIGEFLKLAIAIADCLGQIHRANIIHKDINPNNILFNRETQQVKITDFGISTKRSREMAAFRNVNALEGTPAYISPEQTGRIDREIDCRSDLYSLGVTFYLLLSGRLPFPQKDLAELIHAHIAHAPPLLTHPQRSETVERLVLSGVEVSRNELAEASPVTSEAETRPLSEAETRPLSEVETRLSKGHPLSIPNIIADIVMKLMAKNAEDRYQSAYGLKADLERCWQQWQEKQAIEPFVFGSQDRDDRLQISQKLYGREDEIATLLAAFAGAIEQQHPALCLVKGYSGIGKSALVAKIHKPITAKNGFFVSGKFDQLQRDVPYSAIAQALEGLMKYLFVESSEELQQWRERIQEAVGNNGRVLGKIVPKLEILLGEQPEVPQLGAAESQNRFNFTLQNFIRVFTESHRPLVLFLDDLQWADSASLGLLHLFMTSPDMGNLFIVGAYRDNEVNNAHPLLLTIDKIRTNHTPIAEITLAPLPLEKIEQFVADTLCCSRPRVRLLTELLQEKTNGNPFFLKKFIEELYLEELLNFDWHKQEWLWDIERIRDRDITANVVDLLAGQLNKLSLDTQRLIRFAACIGNEFDLFLLGAISDVSLADCVGALQSAIAEGFLMPLDDAYKLVEANIPSDRSPRLKFVHDRIQQAAYKLILDNDKTQIHWRLGRLLLQQVSPEEREERIFEIVNHWNLVRQHIREESERDELVQLNLMAGKKAKASAARRSALNYLQTGLKLLSRLSWQTYYELTWDLHVETIEAAYLCTEFELLDELVEITLKHTSSVLEQVRVYEAKINALVARERGEEAISTALEIAALLGIQFPKKATKFQILLNLTKTNVVLMRKQPSDLIDLPSMSDPSTQAAIGILSSIIPLIYRWNPQLFPLITLKMVRLSLKQGNAPLSAFTYACYAIILCGVLGEIERGYQFGQLALQVWSRFNIKAHKAKILMPVALFTLHWKCHLQESLSLFLESYQTALDTGDLEFVSISALEYIRASYWTGKTLSILKQDIEIYGRSILQFKQAGIIDIYEQDKQFIVQLTDPKKGLNLLKENPYFSDKRRENKKDIRDKSSFFYSLKNKAFLLYLFAEYSLANQYVEEAIHYLDTIVSTPIFAIFHFYAPLIWLSIHPHVSQSEQRNLLKKVSAYQNKMKQWAHHAPMNYLHKYLLVEAERYRILGKSDRAAEFYNLAIAGAKENEYIQEEALANELAGKFYLSDNRDEIARTYLQQAYRCYDRWGAKAKTQHLLQTYPQLLDLENEKFI
ncbi:MAG: serine/threonine-protein kinase PknK [Cyanobacteria bacterium SBLK]|nr:serine/threonine-protein kinase PknK [Cyanobacteria bacterium SBLK]